MVISKTVITIFMMTINWLWFNTNSWNHFRQVAWRINNAFTSFIYYSVPSYPSFLFSSHLLSSLSHQKCYVFFSRYLTLLSLSLILILSHLVGYVNMMPAQGAWGVWYLPGSKEFHVAWTGVVEFLAGLWLIIGAASTAIFGISLPDAFQLGTGIMS